MKRHEPIWMGEYTHWLSI